MTKIAPAILAVAILCLGAAGFAQETTGKVAIINIQEAIARSSDGQAAATKLQARFGPTRENLTKLQAEVGELQTKLRNGSVLSDDARTKMMRELDDKTKQLNRETEDAQAAFQQAEQDAINEIGRKMMGIIDEYAKTNKYAMILDVSSPQTPVLYADAAIDITPAVIEIYNQAHAAPAASAAPAAAPAAPPAAAPAAPAAPTP